MTTTVAEAIKYAIAQGTKTVILSPEMMFPRPAEVPARYRIKSPTSTAVA